MHYEVIGLGLGLNSRLGHMHASRRFGEDREMDLKHSETSAHARKSEVRGI